MLGTKWPSMTSMCTQSAPAAVMARTSSPSFEKSLARMEGAMTTDEAMPDLLAPQPGAQGGGVLGRPDKSRSEEAVLASGQLMRRQPRPAGVGKAGLGYSGLAGLKLVQAEI